MSFFSEIRSLKTELEDRGFKVYTPSEEGTEIDYSLLTKQQQVEIKRNFINKHIRKIKDSDAILLANFTKNEKANYIGANSFLEMAFAYILSKEIFILHSIPNQTNTLEIEGLNPIQLQGNLDSLNI